MNKNNYSKFEDEKEDKGSKIKSKKASKFSNNTRFNKLKIIIFF